MTDSVIGQRIELPLGNFWYFIVFIAGLYYGITYVSGGMNTLFFIIAPPVLCIFNAIVACLFTPEKNYGNLGISRRILLGAVTLYVNFLFSFTIGYIIASVGIIRFEYNK